MCVRYISMVRGGVSEPSSSADLPANVPNLYISQKIVTLFSPAPIEQKSTSTRPPSLPVLVGEQCRSKLARLG